jgi:hypothetical protein
MDFESIKRLPYMSKRMYTLERICKARSVDLDYLFGLFNLYNQKNSGRWFWQRATFTGGLKDAYDSFNKVVENIVKKMKKSDEAGFDAMIEDSTENLDKLMTGMEANCEINRDNDYNHVRGLLDNNFKGLINDSMKPFKQEKTV